MCGTSVENVFIFYDEIGLYIVKSVLKQNKQSCLYIVQVLFNNQNIE